MVRLNRTSEYGLMALRHMSRKGIAESSASSNITSAREISESYGLPFEITAKTLQRLKDTGLIQSAHGARGGYSLKRPLQDISLGEFLELMEGPQAIVACAGTSTGNVTRNVQDPQSKTSCEYVGKCEIHSFMSHVNARVSHFLAGIPLAEISEFQTQPLHQVVLEPTEIPHSPYTKRTE